MSARRLDGRAANRAKKVQMAFERRLNPRHRIAHVLLKHTDELPRSHARSRVLSASDSQLLVHEPRDLVAVGSTLGLAHHVTHDRADRLGVLVHG